MNNDAMSLPWLALNAVRGLGPARIRQLLERFETAEEILNHLPHALSGIGIPNGLLSELTHDSLLENAERQLEAAHKAGARVLTLDHQEYPALLREIFAPPPVLFIRGDVSVFKKHGIGIVGTRRPSAYGRNAARFLADGLARADIAVVSGMARGIDTAAHTACLDAGTPTIAVFGCGIDRVYPAENKGLAERIIACGAVVSEFPPGTRPERYNFPRRNRIISGLSAGVIVVESAKRGGALISAEYALQQGREVFAVPGTIFSDQSIGTHELLRAGATPVRDADEVLEGISAVSNRAVRPVVSETTSIEFLSSEERSLFEALSTEPLHMDILSEKTEIAIETLMTVLLNLELRGMIKQLPGNQFVRSAG